MHVKIQYDNGVDILIEGAAAFELERSGIYLEYGRLFSRVTKLGTGFRVDTPISQFADMETEFWDTGRCERFDRIACYQGQGLRYQRECCQT